MGNKMTATEIIRLLEILIGPTTAVGETSADERIHDNLRTLIDVADWCLGSVHTSSFTCGRSEYSMNKVGFYAKCALDGWRTWLEDVCGEMEVQE